jgi:two-component system, OmpR family, catabolic regulation response regulator CreB
VGGAVTCQAIADTLIYALGSGGFAVRHLLLGREAAPAHRASPFDLIILDIGLPDSSGFDVLRELREDA